MSTLKLQDGTKIFYKDWGLRKTYIFEPRLFNESWFLIFVK